MFTRPLLNNVTVTRTLNLRWRQKINNLALKRVHEQYLVFGVQQPCYGFLGNVLKVAAKLV